MHFARRVLEYTEIVNPIRIVAFGDTHVGSNTFARNRFKNFLLKQSQHPNTYFVGMGDFFDALVVSDKKRFRLSNIDKKYFDCNNPDQFLDTQVEDMTELLLPYKDKILGLIRGNHEDEILKRYNTDLCWQLCKNLGGSHLDWGYSALILLNIRFARTGPSGGSKSRAVKLFLHHGFGGGTRTEGGAISSYARFITYYSADIYLVAHSHQLWSKKIARIGINKNGDWEDRSVILANTGTWKRSLSDTVVPTWEERMGFNPRLLGGTVVELKLNRHNSFPDISVSEI